jgi:hypothetical protein
MRRRDVPAVVLRQLELLPMPKKDISDPTGIGDARWA